MWTVLGIWWRGLAPISGRGDRATTPLDGNEKELAQHFFAAAEQGDLPALEALLAQDVALHADGGGKVPALPRRVNGRERVARTFLAGMSALARRGVRLQITEVNG